MLAENLLNEIGFNVFVSTGNNYTIIKNNLALISSLEFNGSFLRENKAQLNLSHDKIYDHTSRTKLFKV